MNKKKILSILIISLIILFFLSTICKAKDINKKNELKFKAKVISKEGNILKVEVDTIRGEKIIILTEKDKDFKISKNNINWYFHPVVKGSKISFKITKKVNDKKEWKDCCAKCAGGFEACGSLGVCCRKNHKCCGIGCPCGENN